MFQSVRHHTKTRAALTAIAATFTLGALAPAAANAADPVRPMTEIIAEVGGGVNDDQVYVHGTNGVDNIEIKGATYNGQPALHIRSAQPIRAGGQCLKQPYFNDGVFCPQLRRLHVKVYDGSDSVVIFSTARNNSIELWGGRDQDALKVEAGAYPAVLLGGDGDDRLTGSIHREALWGGPGNDWIRPGGGPDHIDGGHGDFNAAGPVQRAYADNPAECAARTHGFWDRYDNAGNSTAEGVDTLDLSALNEGVLADINVCRLGWFHNSMPALVHGMEHVLGTRFNDRLVGDGDRNFLRGGAGNDWLTGESNTDTIEANDGEVDTVKCSIDADTLRLDSIDQKLNCR